MNNHQDEQSSRWWSWCNVSAKRERERKRWLIPTFSALNSLDWSWIGKPWPKLDPKALKIALGLLRFSKGRVVWVGGFGREGRGKVRKCG